MKLRSIPSLSIAAVLFITGLTAVPSAVAQQTDTWQGNSDNTWATGPNWVGGNSPPLSGDALVFGAAGASGVDLNNNLTSLAFSVSGITFNPGAAAFVIGNGSTNPNVGNAFALTGSVTNNSMSLETINNPFTLTGTQTFSTTTGAGNIILGGSITGSGGLVQAGPGTLVLNGSNNYTGATVVKSGLLEIGTLGSLYGGNSASWASNISVASGGTLAVTIGGPSDFSANGGAQAAALLASTFQVGSYFGFDTTNSVTSVLAQGVTASSSLFQDGAYLSAPITVQNTFGISKLGTGTLVLLASNGNTYTGGTSVANGELVMQGTGGAGAVSVTNSIPQGTTVLSVQNSEALGDRTLTKSFNPISLNATGGSLSASILEIGAKQGTNTVTGNTWDFAYGVVAAGATPGNGQISLSPSASGGNNSGVGFAAFNAGSLSTPRIVGLLAVVNGTTVTTATLQTLQEGTYFAAGNHLTLGSPTANNTLDLLNPVDLNAASGAAGAEQFVSIRGVSIVPEGEYAGAIINSNTAGAGGILVNFSGNGGLIFASPTSSYVAQTLQVNGGGVFVGTGDPAAAGQTGPFGSGAAALQIGTSATSGGANLGFMTYGANAGVGPAPTIITNRSLVVGGNGAPSTGVVLGGFTDDYTAINGSITLNGSATFTANGPAAGGRVDFNGTISGSGAVVVGNGSSTYVEGDSNANGIKGIQLTNNGTVVFAGANGYTGPTTINNGELYVNGSLNAASAVSVLSGATLGGKGTVNGAVTVQAGGMLEGGQLGAGTLTLGGDLSFTGSGSAINFGGLAAFGGSGLAINGSLSIASPVTINVTGAIPGTKYYPLIRSSSLNGSSTSSFVVGSLPARAAAHLAVSGGDLFLDVTALYSVAWTGNNGSDWNGAGNFIQMGGVDPFSQFQPGDAVVFSNTATNTSVTLNTGNVSPSSVTFTNTTATYTLSGANGISGVTGLSVTGGGLVILTNTNTYTGPTSILTAGTLQLGNGTTGQDGAIYYTSRIANSGALVYDLAGAQTYGGVISGGGSLTKTGGGTLVLTNADAASATTISGGTLQLGLGSYGNDGTLSGPIVDNGTLVASFFGTQTLSGLISGTGKLTKTGIGTLTLSGSNFYSGPTTVSAGILTAGAANALPPSSAVVVSGGTLDATGFPENVGALTVGSLGSLNLTVGSVLSSSSGATLNGTLNLFDAGSGSTELMSYLSHTGIFATVNGVPPGESLDYTSTALYLIAGPGNNSVLGASTSSISLGRVMLNYVPTATVTIGLTGGTSATGFSASASGGASALALGNGPGAVTPSASGTVTIGLTNATGSYSGSVQVQNSGDDGSGNGPSSAGAGQGNAQPPLSISVSGTVVDNRVVTSSSASFGVVHVGSLLSQGITLSTNGSDSQYTRVTVANGSNGFLTVSGGSNPTFNGPAVTDNRTLSGIAGTAGALNGTITLTTIGEGLAGESPINVQVPYSVEVFSGSGVWNGSSGAWGGGGSTNWTDANGSGIQAAPGTFAGFANTDSAIFSGSGAVTAIDLTGVIPSLKALGFSNSSYTLSNGSLTLNGSSGTATVTVSSGTQTINTPITLASNANFAVNGGALLLNSTISGSGGLITSGSGTVTLPGADTLSSTGPISVLQGTLAAPLGIPHAGGGITVAVGATLQAAGQIKRAVTGAGTVTATDELVIGDATQTGQFNQGGPAGVGGTLNAGGNAVVILSADTAILGSQTNLGEGGSLTALNGAQLGNPTSVDATKVLTATGNATINANFVNNGVVNGPTGGGQELTFTQAVQGAGSTTGNVEYAASYRVGNSPDAVSVQNVLLDPTSTLIMELDGTTPGSGYDQLDVTGLATLNGTLELTYLDGFSPSEGESFDLFNGKTSGSFVQISLPTLSNGLSWDTSSLYANGTVSVVPEPSGFALLAVAAVAVMVGIASRGRKSSHPRRSGFPA